MKNKEDSIFKQAVLHLFGKENYETKAGALLYIFYIAGYLAKEKLANYVVKLGFKNPLDIFYKLSDSVKIFEKTKNTEIFAEDFGQNTGLSLEDTERLIVYMAQNAFGRKKGEERNSLKIEDWQEKHKEDFLMAANTLGLLEDIYPKSEAYDYAFILGASRRAMAKRIENYVKYTKNKKVSKVFVLCGNRKLSELDGIGENPETKKNDAEKYRKYLSDKYNVAEPTETNIAKDILDSMSIKDFVLIDSSVIHKERPNTRDTLEEAFKFLEKDGETKILVYSNQPYLKRQFTEARIVSLKAGKFLKLEEAGFGNKTGNVSLINSELAALTATLYEYSSLTRGREAILKDLSYQTRDNSEFSVKDGDSWSDLLALSLYVYDTCWVYGV